MWRIERHPFFTIVTMYWHSLTVFKTTAEKSWAYMLNIRFLILTWRRYNANVANSVGKRPLLFCFCLLSRADRHCPNSRHVKHSRQLVNIQNRCFLNKNNDETSLDLRKYTSDYLWRLFVMMPQRFSQIILTTAPRMTGRWMRVLQGNFIATSACFFPSIKMISSLGIAILHACSLISFMIVIPSL